MSENEMGKIIIDGDRVERIAMALNEAAFNEYSGELSPQAIAEVATAVATILASYVHMVEGDINENSLNAISTVISKVMSAAGDDVNKAAESNNKVH